MDNIMKFVDGNTFREVGLEVRSQKIDDQINKVSGIIKDLNITTDDNNQLVEALAELVSVLKKESFLSGFDMGMKLIKGEINNGK